jgi:hypothetical protein
MVSFREYYAFFISTVAILLHAVSGARAGCYLDRTLSEDLDPKKTCVPPASWNKSGKEIYCLMKLNTLGEIMDCIGGVQTKICRGKANDPNTYDDEDYTTQDGKDDSYCLNPRYILTNGTKSDADSKDDSIRGVLKACPYGDPDYRNCLCEWGVTEPHLLHFSRHFKKDPSADFECALGKRSVHVEDADLDTVSGVPIRNESQSLELRKLIEVGSSNAVRHSSLIETT